MEVQILTFRKAAARLGIGGVSFGFLLDNVDIAEFGEERRDLEGMSADEIRHVRRRIRVAATLTDARSLWTAIGKQGGWRVEGQEGLDRYRGLRGALVTSDEPHPREAVLGVAALFPKMPTVRQMYAKLGGAWATMDGVMAVVDGHFAVRERQKQRGRIARDLPMAEFLERNAQFVGLEGTTLDPEFGSPEKTSTKLLGRTEAMRSPALRDLLGLTLLAGPGRLAERTLVRCTLLIEALNEVADPSECVAGMALIATLERLLAQNVLDLTTSHREHLLNHYKWLATALRGWHDELPPERRAAFSHLIPPPVPPALAERLAGILRDVATDRADRRGRTAKPISMNRNAILGAVELRFRALDRLTTKVAARCRDIEARLARGEHVTFPVTVSDTFAVVRPGIEGQGVGRQTVRVLIDTSARLWEDCARKEQAAGLPDNERRAWHWISAAAKDRIRPSSRGGSRTAGGSAWSQHLEIELRVVYVGTTAEKPGGECVEPFWVDLFRSRLFDSDAKLTEKERDERAALISLIGADVEPIHAPGMMTDTSRAGRSLARTYGRLNPTRCVAHLEEFCHAMAVGRVILRPELLRGMRIGESSQARADPGAFSFRKFDGKLYYYLKAIPKLGRGRYRRMVLDKVTIGAFERVRVLAVERFPSGSGNVPTRPFHDPERKDVPEGRYLLCNADRTLFAEEMNIFLRLLTIGIVDSTSHSYKSGFAAMMKTARASGPMLNHACNHAIGSPVSEGYARWASDHMMDAFVAEQQEEIRRRQLDWELLE